MLFLQSHTIHAGVMGVICGGLHALGPDHLATLMAFSTLLEPWAAARVGAAWGLGHCAGVAAIATLVFLAGRIPGVSFESWERNGDYIIGASMIIVALYFIYREERYVHLDKHGQVHLHSCGCCDDPDVLEEARHRHAAASETTHEDSSGHGHTTTDAEEARHWHAAASETTHEDSSGHGHTTTDAEDSSASSSRSPSSRSRGSKSLCGDYGAGGCKDQDCEDQACKADSGHHAKETTPLLGKLDATDGRGASSALVGMIQGMCCPMGLIQLSFLAGRNMADTAIFILVTMTVSVSGTATVAAAWAALTRSSVTSVLSPRLMYRMSCGMAFFLGIVWITANYLDVLDKVNYAESGSDGMHVQ